MLKDIPYSTLSQDEPAYKIMMLRDQSNTRVTDIAKMYKISISRVRQIYHRLKTKQIRMYINHISIMLGHKNTSQIKEIYSNAYECYQDQAYACAYLEVMYKSILTKYRNGEAGMPAQFVKNMPLYKPLFGEAMTIRVLQLRDIKKASFIAIAEELYITQAKARDLYEKFYHKQVLELIEDLQAKAESKEEEKAIWNHCFEGKYKTAKSRYDELTKENI